jgi:hypothetical protein
MQLRLKKRIPIEEQQMRVDIIKGVVATIHAIFYLSTDVSPVLVRHYYFIIITSYYYISDY